MLKDLRKYEHLGTPNFYYTLLKFIGDQENNPISKDLVNKHFYGKVIDGRRGFRGAIEFAITIDLLTEDNGFVTIDNHFYRSYINSQNTEALILKIFFSKINADSYFEIFNPDNFEFTYNSRNLVIANSAFKFKHSNIKSFLLDFGFLVYNEQSEGRYYNIKNDYFVLLDSSILPKISKKKRRISVSEFDKSIEDRNRYGHEAELFVYEFECERLLNSKKLDWTSLHTVNEGYDITSYNIVDDLYFNRFIEVKSFYGDKPYFYLSENEYKTAEEIGKHYWLYLVNRKYIHQQDYQPLMIQNPYANIFSNPNWKMTEEKTYKLAQT